MAYYDSNYGGYRVFIGDIGRNARRSEIERECERYGTVLDCWLARNAPIAFAVFKHSRDAEDCVAELDGRTVGNRRIRVEFAKPYEAAGKSAAGGRRDRRSRSRSRDRRRSRSRSRSRDRRRDRSRSRSRRRDRSASDSSNRDRERDRDRDRDRRRSKSGSRSESDDDERNEPAEQNGNANGSSEE